MHYFAERSTETVYSFTENIHVKYLIVCVVSISYHGWACRIS